MVFPRVFSLYLAIAFSLFLLSSPAFAKRTLTISGDEVLVYSGPGKFFRPIAKLSKGEEVNYSEKITKNEKGAEFYRVVINKGGKKQVGFIAVEDMVTKEAETAEPDEEIDNFSEFPLSGKSVQLAYTQLKTERALMSIGYLMFIAPAFYTKIHLGAYKAPDEMSTYLGVEAGAESSTAARLTAFVFGSANAFINPKENALFEGSKKNLSNFMIQAALGLRYTFGNQAAVSLGPTQAVLFNANNSNVTFGGILTLEWPL